MNHLYINIYPLVFLGIMFTACAPKDAKLRQPNVLFISLDDLNDWAQPLAGNEQSLTPNLLRFGKEAVNFSKTYCASPGCNPSRGAVLTGIHTYRSGLYSNYQDWRLIPKLAGANTLNRHFKQNGYYTAGAGKIYHYDQVDTSGWNDYFPSIKQPMPKDNFPYKVPSSMPRFPYMYNMFDWAGLDIEDEETGDFQSVNYISQQFSREHDKPFFLACGIYRPHLPWYVPQKYVDMFPLDQIQLPTIMENDTADLGSFAKNELMKRGGNYHRHIVQAGLWKEAVRGYLSSIAFADAMVGRLLTALANSAYADNTIVVIWSDHGWQLGEKNHWRKFALWENVNRSLLMIKVPKGTIALPQGSDNGTSAGLASLLDIYPTLIELCGLGQRENLDGRSLVPILRNNREVIDRPIITTYDYGSYSVRYQNWHYIRYVDDSEELYDLDKDPEEWYNLASLAELAQTKNGLIKYIPENPVPLPISSLLPLQEHHVPPVQSKEDYFSAERRAWMQRFE